MNDASALCLDFLAALEARDLGRARDMISDGFEMTFPGDVRFREFDDLLEWAAPRYRRIAKEIERVEETSAGEVVAIHVSGTLHGEWMDGTPFQGIRFIDRFEIRAGRITRQEVWNDMGEAFPR